MGHTRFSDGNELPASAWNAVMDAIESQSAKMFGLGVLSGLELSDEGGFNLGISAGTGNWLRAKDLDAFEYELPPSVTRFVWIDEAAAITLTATTAHPGGQKFCLGKAVTDGSGITSVSNEGRMRSLWWIDERTLAIGLNTLVVDNLSGRVGLGLVPTVALESLFYLRGPGLELVEQADAPDPVAGHAQIFSKPVDVDGVEEAEVFVQHESAGEVQLMRGAHHLHSVNAETISATKDLTARDANVQVLTPSGSHRDVILPAFADMGWGDWFDIINPHASLNLVLKAHADDGGATVQTITPGKRAPVRPVHDTGGAAAWPSTVTLETMSGAA